jgi:GNAT superfamily N-acetyltransferase
MDDPVIDHGFTEAERPRVGALYWSAFGSKLRTAFRDDTTGRSQVTAGLRADRTLVARDHGAVVAVCGYHRDGHGAADLSWRRLRENLGVTAALRASVVLAPLDRHERSGVLVLDGVCVSAERRGQGIGSALLDAVTVYGAGLGHRWVQLSVIDTNPRAEALYRRCGFDVVGEGSVGALRHLYGFERYKTMRKRTGRW